MAAPPSAPEVLIAPSLLSCDFARIADEVRRAEDAGADWLHVDVMDGHFVPNLTIGPPVVAAIAKVARVPLDVHLMISEPARYAAEFVTAGAHVLTFHAEVAGDASGARELARAFRAAGARAVGMALNPDTPLEPFEEVLGELDLVLVMSVFPGFGGQRFLEHVLAKTRRVRELGYAGRLEMDGGLNGETIPACAAAGADVLVSGSALFAAPDMKAAVARFRAAALEARASGGAPASGGADGPAANSPAASGAAASGEGASGETACGSADRGGARHGR